MLGFYLFLMKESRPGSFFSRQIERLRPKSQLYATSLDVSDERFFDPRLVGNKGRGLVELHALDLPVPPAFILTTAAWRDFTQQGNTIERSLEKTIEKQLVQLEQLTERRLGDPNSPLFVSVRSGAAVSMPGAMETILNIGINDETIPRLANEIGEEAARNAYSQLISQFRTSIFGSDPFFEFPQDPRKQLKMAIACVFKSWDNETARDFREAFKPEAVGTAAIVQQMVFGNSEKENSGAGVLFTYDPVTLRPTPKIGFVPNAQGPEVVGETAHSTLILENFPEDIQSQLKNIVAQTKSLYESPQEIEFTIEGDTVYVLQTRDAVVSPVGRLRALRRSVRSGQLDEERAMREITARQLEAILLPDLDPNAVKGAIEKEGRLLAEGEGISPGHVTGPVVFSLDRAREMENEEVILAAQLTLRDLLHLPENIKGAVAANGGIGSHIARVAEQIGRNGIPFVFGAPVKGVSEEETITVDGRSGLVLRGTIPIVRDGESSLLTKEELKMAKRWYDERINNPWRFTTAEEGISRFETQADEAYKYATEIQKYKSHKAQEVAVSIRLIPKPIRLEYSITRPDNIAYIKKRLREVVAQEGCEASIRTCHVPPLEGGGPWARVASEQDIEELFTNPEYSKYGNYNRMILDAETEDNGHLTAHKVKEILIGKFPEGKLDPAPEVQKEHCAWTMSATSEGDVVLKIRPFSSQLRDHDTVSSDDMITVILAPVATREQDAVLERDRKIGANINPHDAKLFLELVFENIAEWWAQYNLPKRLAAITSVFPSTKYGVPILQGQGRVGAKTWCKLYDINIDPRISLP